MRYAMVLVLAAATAHAAEPGKPANPLFAKKCSTCHGADGKGKAAMAKMFKVKPEELDLTAGEATKKTEADLLKLVTEGKNKMPAFKGKLKDAEIADLVAYVRSLAVKPEAAPEAKPAAAK